MPKPPNTNLVSQIATLTALVEGLQKTSEKTLKALEGNGQPGLLQRVTMTEMRQAELTASTTEDRETVRTLAKCVDEVSDAIAKHTAASNPDHCGKAATAELEGAVDRKISTLTKTVQECADLVKGHVDKNNPQHKTLAVLWEDNPIRFVLGAIGVTLFITLGVVSGYFEHIIEFLKKFIH